MVWYKLRDVGLKYLSCELRQLSFKPLKLDQSLFYKGNMATLFYVDDLIFFGKNLDKIYQIINKFNQRLFTLTVETIHSILWALALIIK